MYPQSIFFTGGARDREEFKQRFRGPVHIEPQDSQVWPFGSGVDIKKIRIPKNGQRQKRMSLWQGTMFFPRQHNLDRVWVMQVYIYIHIIYIYIWYIYFFLYIHICMFCLYSVLISCTNTGGWIVSTRLGITTACPHVLVVNTSHPGASYSSLVAERCAGILVCFILYSCYCKLIDLLATIIDTKLTCVFIQ